MMITDPEKVNAVLEKLLLPFFPTTTVTTTTITTTTTTTTTMILGFIVPPFIVMMMMMMYMNNNHRRTTTTTTTTRKNCRYGCTPVLYNTIQGRSYPILGHAITFLLHSPWDLLTLWHQKKHHHHHHHQNACTKSSSSSSSPPDLPTQQEPIICFPLMGHTMFSIASPIYCKYILQSKIVHVQKDIYKTMKPFLSILGTGIVSSEGKHWLQQRLKMSHPLRHDILHIIPLQTLYAVQRLFTILDTAAAATNTTSATTTPNTSVPIGSLLRHLTLQVISSSFLSLSHNESDETFAKLYLPIVDECNQRVWHPYRAYLFILPSFWIYLYNVYRLNAYVSSLIRKRWVLRCQERSGTSDTTTTQRRIDILDKILQVYESSSSSSSSSSGSNTTTDDDTTGGIEPVMTNYNTVLPESIVKQVRDEMKTFMLAGHETSAALMTWTMYELLLSQTTTATTNYNNDSPTLLDKVIMEANHVFDPKIDWSTATEVDIPPTSDSGSSSSSLQHLSLIEACLKEALRKYSVVPIVARRVVQDLYLPKHHKIDTTSTIPEDESLQADHYFLPKGSTVLINIQAVHLDPNIWPQPMKYDPYRFLHVEPQTVVNQNGSNKSSNDANSKPSAISFKEIEPYTFLPFIAGPRNCLGQHLALLETKMVIALLFQRYEFTLPDDILMPSSNTNMNSTNDDNVATSWRDSTAIDPRHRFMVPIIPKREVMLRVSRKKGTNQSTQS